MTRAWQSYAEQRLHGAQFGQYLDSTCRAGLSSRPAVIESLKQMIETHEQAERPGSVVYYRAALEMVRGRDNDG